MTLNESLLLPYLQRYLMLVEHWNLVKNALNKDAKLDYKAIYDYILGLDPDIRFIGVIDDMGRLVYGGMRPGKTSLESETESIKIFMEFALISKLHTDFDSTLGEVVYSLTVRKKIKMLSFPITAGHIIRLSLEKKADHEKIVNAILIFLDTLNNKPGL